MPGAKAQRLIAAVCEKNIPHEPLSDQLCDNLLMLDALKRQCADLVIHEFLLFGKTRAAVAFLEGMIDDEQCGQFLLRPLSRPAQADIRDVPVFLQTCQIQRQSDVANVLRAIFSGSAVIFADTDDTATIAEIRSSFGRNVAAPEFDRSVIGAHEGFVEKIVVNIALVRRKLCDPQLCISNVTVGRRAAARLSVAYVRDIADPTCVAAVLRKLRAIDADSIGSAGALIQYLEDAPHFIFPQIMPIERADVAAAMLLEGRVVVFMDQIPQAMVLPAVWWDFFRASDDHGEKAYIGSFKRWLRVACFFAGVLLPAWYVALVTFHPELIPLELALPLLSYRSSVPFSVTAEVLFVETLLAILAEAAVRTPNQMSQTIGLVGGVILGQALLSSNLATAPTLVIATAGIVAQYAMPSFVMMRLMSALRLAGIAAAAVGGLFGVSIFWFLLLARVAAVKTYSVPYAAPLGTSDLRHLKSVLFMRHAARQKKRPTYIPVQDETRQK